MDSEVPEEMLDPDAPPGTPIQSHVAATAAPLWCAHGVKWEAKKVGWVAEDALMSKHQAHNRVAADPGAIPEPCQPTYASYDAWKILTVARRMNPPD